ncbi:MAG: hypothetical protein PHT07_10035 [Paludibacter sp.]|nr:hypothetical protein [Paludibacter sp.]
MGAEGKKDKAIVHCELSGNSAKIYKELSQKNSGIALALRLLARSDMAGAFFTDMSKINAILNEETTDFPHTNIAKPRIASHVEENNTPNTTVQMGTGTVKEKKNIGHSVAVSPVPSHDLRPGEGKGDDDTEFETGWGARPSS